MNAAIHHSGENSFGNHPRAIKIPIMLRMVLFYLCDTQFFCVVHVVMTSFLMLRVSQISSSTLGKYCPPWSLKVLIGPSIIILHTYLKALKYIKSLRFFFQNLNPNHPRIIINNGNKIRLAPVRDWSVAHTYWTVMDLITPRITVTYYKEN